MEILANLLPALGGFGPSGVALAAMIVIIIAFLALKTNKFKEDKAVEEFAAGTARDMQTQVNQDRSDRDKERARADRYLDALRKWSTWLYACYNGRMQDRAIMTMHCINNNIEPLQLKPVEPPPELIEDKET